ncbi:hypothetical protein EDB89DRAFT_564870 [Lactarius sanguifluus]|nr:hypothetical protein EDB89DRAFT_564870 [Lactarius sanguifluus]
MQVRMSTVLTSSPGRGTSSADQLLGKFSLFTYADIILRSSDSHDFRVQKLYVVDSSPVLAERITAHGVGPEVVQLPENCTILSTLLTFVFPVPSVLPSTIEQILELLSVAQKYEMTTTLDRIRDCVSRRNPNLICAETALEVYSLAWKYGLLEEALRAAEETLKTPMTIDNFEDKLNIIPVPALCGLWSYHVQVLDNLNSRLQPQNFPGRKYTKAWLG